MSLKNTYIGLNKVEQVEKSVRGDIVDFWGDAYYKISNYDHMDPFLMSIVSESDIWMFISSNGALTAGRRNPDNALFPYYTDDRIHDSQDITGSKTILLVTVGDRKYLWEPFSSRYRFVYNTENNLYKNILGNQVIFEEINYDLSLTFRYAWTNCDYYGFIKKSQIINHNNHTISVRLLDGIQNILPSGTDKKFQLEYSTLLDGYKRNELVPETDVALYTLSSIPTDKAEPSESLRCTVVWSLGLKDKTILLSDKQVAAFRRDDPVERETDIKGRRGAYFAETLLVLPHEHMKDWYFAADVNKDQSDVIAHSDKFASDSITAETINLEIQKSRDSLTALTAKADGCQQGQDVLNSFRHVSNTLFNVMRGGIFDNNYKVQRDDFTSFICTANKHLAGKYNSFLSELPDEINHHDLLCQVALLHDVDFEKLCYEYLPITFSRRHGDPSRPWNYFSIDIKDEDGRKVLNYQGNWRDIFQNWEAIAHSYPDYIENMITKFINASTADGYNPYRVTRDGFDWEVLDPDDAWSYIGYWGDHQIIYLLKLLELSHYFNPGKLTSLLSKNIFAYANVPYRIRSFDKILEDSQNTVDFDPEEHNKINKRVEKIGTDGKFVFTNDDMIYHVNLTEKLLLPLLVKMSNFIPEAGIWLNTQRPEWNDANNALVGYGTSMVTLYHIRRYVAFLLDLLDDHATESVPISKEVKAFFDQITEVLVEFRHVLSGSISDSQRKQIVKELGYAGSAYRVHIYNRGFSDSRTVIKNQEIVPFLQLVLEYIDHSIRANKRSDNLYHSYNLIKINDDGVQIRRLYEMLEGQVAVLSSRYLSVNESLSLLKSLKQSNLYRQDQNSYMLYPNRDLARFVDKNTIPESILCQSRLLLGMIERKDWALVKLDVNGNAHFNSKFRNAGVLRNTIDQLAKNGQDISKEEITEVLDMYETVFDHQSFTGRSGTFYKYEGLGSIYWHMISKLLLAVQETFFRAVDEGIDNCVLYELRNIYYEIKDGIGVHKNPQEYGAFPTDPYSHTPGHTGAQQPGMTGQVKEDLISRWGELGLFVRDGKIHFSPSLFKSRWFLDKSQVFYYYDLKGKKQSLMLSENMFAYTFCQVPVIYILSDQFKICLVFKDGSEEEINDNKISNSISQSIFRREDKINIIKVMLSL
jgi:hypothetical protein